MSEDALTHKAEEQARSSTVFRPLPPAVEELLRIFCQERDVSATLRFRESESAPFQELVRTGTTPRHAQSASQSVEHFFRECRYEIEVAAPTRAQAERDSRFLHNLLVRVLRYEMEVRYSHQELTERFEEITLLYSINEILGSHISLDSAASAILCEVAGVLSSLRASLWVLSADEKRLELAATVGEREPMESVETTDPYSIAAQVFRESKLIRLEPQQQFPRDEPQPLPLRGQREYVLSVPVTYTSPEGVSLPRGVITLIRSAAHKPFDAGDIQLVRAIASQIGSAVENARLVRESLIHERMEHELSLAQLLQQEILPAGREFRGPAEVAARCEPARSVGGDFYYFLPLSEGRVGVLLGDVSGHGYAAALLMTRLVTTVAIYASQGHSPNQIVSLAHQTLYDQLEASEMYLSLFYGILDVKSKTLTYTNAGHPHAFRIRADAEPLRLAATDPPVGLLPATQYDEAVAAWDSTRDLLFLFTDGLLDAQAHGELEGERRLLERAQQNANLAGEEILDRLFALDKATSPADDRTAVLVRSIG